MAGNGEGGAPPAELASGAAAYAGGVLAGPRSRLGCLSLMSRGAVVALAARSPGRSQCPSSRWSGEFWARDAVVLTWYFSPMDLQLETPRLLLRPLTLGDTARLRSLLIDPDVRRWLADGRILSEAHVRGTILKSLSTLSRFGTGAFAIWLRADGAFAGSVGLFPGKLASLGGLELGAAVWPRYWRRGLAAEACRAILDDAFRRVGLRRVFACADAPNLRSLALITSLGFNQIGTTPGVFGAIRWFALDRS